MHKAPLYPAPAAPSPELAAELRRASRAYTRGLLCLLALLLLAAALLNACAPAQPAARSYRAEHPAPSARGWHEVDTADE